MKILITTFVLSIFMTHQAMAEEPVAGISLSLQGAYEYEMHEKEIIEKAIEKYSNLYKVDADLIKAIILIESEGNIKAFHKNKNGTTDHGLMQINSSNHTWLKKELGITDFYDPEQNIKAGAYILSSLKYPDYHKLLMAYNMGLKKMKELWQQGITSTKYSRKVMDKLKKIKEGSNEL